MSTATEIISRVQYLVGDPNGNYHTQALLIDPLNMAIQEICNKEKCIRETQFIPAVASQYQYGLPDNFIQIDMCAFSDGSFYPLRLATLNQITMSQYTGSSGNPERYDIWGSARIERATGVATGGSSTTLIDTTVNFTLPTFPETIPLVGDLVVNTTDDSEGIITDVTATVITMAGNNQLQGGALDSFSSGHGYRITSPHAPNKRLILDRPPGSSDPAGTESIAVWGARRHFLVTQAMISTSRDDLELDEELEPALIRRIAQYAQEREFGVASQEGIAQYTYYKNELAEAQPVIRSRINEARSTWMQSVVLNRFAITGPADAGNPYNTLTIR